MKIKLRRIFRRSRIALSKAAKSSWHLFAFSTGIIFLSAGMVRAQLIDVDFNNNSYGAGHGGPNPGPTMSGAAVLGAAGDQWNGIDVSSGTGVPLLYANGSNSPVTMTFTSGGGYDANSYGGSTPFASIPYDALMEDYLYTKGTPQTITLSGLAANSIYNLILYNAADVAGAGRTTYFTVNGNTQTSTWNGSSSTLIAGVDYVEFPSAMSDGSGNMVITWTGNGSAEGDINGFQIQSVQTAPWTTTGSMQTGRFDHTATLLPNGKVLVAGGFGTNSITLAMASAELYDPASGTWTTTGSLNTARDFHTATLLPNGKVLVAGGYDNSNGRLGQRGAVRSGQRDVDGDRLAEHRPLEFTRRRCCPMARCWSRGASMPAAICPARSCTIRPPGRGRRPAR